MKRKSLFFIVILICLYSIFIYSSEIKEDLESKLYDAIYENDINLFEKLLNRICDEKRTDLAIKYIILCSRSSMLKLLLSKDKSNIDVLFDGDTFLIYAIKRSRYEMVEILLQFGANVNKKNIRGNSPLLMAIICNNLNIVELLIENNAEINGCNDDGNTHLMIAIKDNYNDIVRYLLTLNADINIFNINGNNALMMAILYNTQIAHLLLDTINVDVNARSSINGNTALIIAAIRNNHDIIEKLISKGASLILTNNKNENIFDYLRETPEDKLENYQKIYKEEFRKAALIKIMDSKYLMNDLARIVVSYL